MFTSPVIGIIAEYNPFHNGHAYQIRRVKAQFPKAQIVTIMSGSFTQRGEAAVLDKWQRAVQTLYYKIKTGNNIKEFINLC